MADPTSLQPDPSAIGGVSQAPFVRLPDPASLFVRRAQRFRMLMQSRPHLAPYLQFLADIADSQAAAVPGSSALEPIDAAHLARAREFAMPALDRGAFKPDAAFFAMWDRILGALAQTAKPNAAAAALVRVRAAEPATRDAMIANILSTAVPPEAVAEHVLVAAVLQVHFAQLAAGLAAAPLVPVGAGVCPACGGPPMVSLVVGWPGAETARYASCALCSTLWNEVRIKCLVCNSTKGIGYQEIAGEDGTIKAETCDECGSYVKILYQNKNHLLDPMADDVGSLGLDQRLSGGRYRRAGVNPYLVGY